MDTMLSKFARALARSHSYLTGKYMHICAYTSTLIDGTGRSKWRAQGDDFRTFLNAFAACLLQIKLPGLNL